RLLRETLPPDGVFIFTTQVNHPQLQLIAALPNRDGQPWIMKNRSVSLVEGWARAAGFSNVKTALEPHGLFSVSVATL
ncbi:MAG: class I SAM-dependent methyltransferase family protein, partial [Chloroflexota bacterium]